MVRIRNTAGVLAILAVAGVSSAEVILSYTYSDLSGSYDAGAGVYTAVADARTSATSPVWTARPVRPSSTPGSPARASPTSS